MDTERIDELDKFYRPIEQFDRLDSAIFWFSAILSVTVLYESRIPWPQLRDLPSVLFVLSVIVHLILSLYLRFYLMPIAERARRKHLLSNSLGIPLTSERTQKYYNNKLLPSVTRLGANILENALFAKTICTKMAIRERTKVFLYFTVWILAVIWRSTSLGLVVVITQTLFSSEIIEKWLRLELLRHNNEVIYDKLYNDFLHKIDFESTGGIASVLDTFATYEAVKSMAGIKQSSSIFTTNNPALTNEWSNIRDQLDIDKTTKLND